MPKITFKKAFFRIFWKILAKTGPQSLYLCGFPEASVEMEVAPFRASTQRSPAKQNKAIFHVEARPTQGIQTNHKKTSELSPQIRKLAGPFLLYSRIH